MVLGFDLCSLPLCLHPYKEDIRTYFPDEDIEARERQCLGRAHRERREEKGRAEEVGGEDDSRERA